jgi:hypothetical protein
MAFNDPIKPSPTGADYFRIGDGLYAHQNSTADQPSTFSIKSDVKHDAVSSIAIRRDISMNMPDGDPDANASVYVVIRGDLHDVAKPTILAMLDAVNTFITTDTNYERVLRGER